MALLPFSLFPHTHVFPSLLLIIIPYHIIPYHIIPYYASSYYSIPPLLLHRPNFYYYAQTIYPLLFQPSLILVLVVFEEVLYFTTKKGIGKNSGGGGPAGGTNGARTGLTQDMPTF